eukprot:sb/3478295/
MLLFVRVESPDTVSQVGAVTRKYDAARQKGGDNFKKSDFKVSMSQNETCPIMGAKGRINKTVTQTCNLICRSHSISSVLINLALPSVDLVHSSNTMLSLVLR